MTKLRDISFGCQTPAHSSMGNYHRRSQEASHIIYEKYPISKLQSHLEMDPPKIGLQFGLLSLPRSPIKGFLSGCKPLTCAYTAPASSFDGTPGQLDSSPLQHRTVPEVFSFDAEMGLVISYFSPSLTSRHLVWIPVALLRQIRTKWISTWVHCGSPTSIWFFFMMFGSIGS